MSYEAVVLDTAPEPDAQVVADAADTGGKHHSSDVKSEATPMSPANDADADPFDTDNYYAADDSGTGGKHCSAMGEAPPPGANTGSAMKATGGAAVPATGGAAVPATGGAAVPATGGAAVPATGGNKQHHHHPKSAMCKTCNTKGTDFEYYYE